MMNLVALFNSKFVNNINYQHKSKNIYKAAIADLIASFSFWRIFGLIGVNDIRKRYKRSKLGQFWLTLSTCINIGALAIVWSLLFKISVAEYLPFIAVSQVIWIFISTCVIEGASAYISAEHYLKELPIPKVSYINSLFVKNVIILLHNSLAFLPIYFFCKINISWYSLASLLGFLITILFLFGVIMVIAIISLRFRDFPNMIASLIQVVFYVTPVLWKPSFMPEQVQKLMIFNPFAIFLTLCRDPLLNSKVPYEYWIVSLIYTLCSLILAFIFFSKYRARIVYWL